MKTPEGRRDWRRRGSAEVEAAGEGVKALLEVSETGKGVEAPEVEEIGGGVEAPGVDEAD